MKIKRIFSFLNSFVVLVMVILSLILLFMIENLKEDNEWVTHTYKVIHEAEHLMLNMIDQETSMRGYLATGNRDYLEPYNHSLEEFNKNIELLKITVSDNPPQVTKLIEVQMIADQWHSEASDRYLKLKEEILASEDKKNELRVLSRSGKGKEKMDFIRELLKSVEDESTRLKILNSMINMETGVRAYIINREEEYLEPYYEGKENLNSNLALVDDPLLNDASNDWIENVAEREIRLVRDSLDFKTDTDLYNELSLGRGKFIMDKIRDEIDIFVQVEQSLLVERNEKSSRQYQLSSTSIFIALILIVLTGLIQITATNKVTKPLVQFSNQMKAFDPKNINDQITFDDKSVAEVADLAFGYSKLLDALKENLDEREKTNWIQEGQMEISHISEIYTDVNSLLDQLISYLTQKLGGQYGCIYILDDISEGKYIFSAGYAIEDSALINKSIKIGETLTGQAAKERKVTIITDLAENHVNITSALGSSAPNELIVIPCVINDRVIAIFEIASLTKISDLMLEFVNKSITSIAVAISNSLTEEEVHVLLNETKENNEKLKLQQEELKVTNEELESQSNTLMAAQSELESQQENLRVLNEELEESSKILFDQKKILEEKNKDLEISQKIVEDKTEDLIQSNKYKSEFLANMSHELRTPLNSILILSELLGDSKDLSDEEIKYADTINSSGKGLLSLINDILDLSKVESGQVEMDITSMDLKRFKDETVDLFEQLSIKKQLAFSVNLADDIPERILTDEMKLKQIVNNLLSNSFKFTDSGSVVLSVKRNNEFLEFEVSDTGIGISDDKIDLIFVAFKQEDGTTSRKFGGTGLGLSISAQYSKMLGGQVNVSSEKGKGSKFTLSIPIAIEEETVNQSDLVDGQISELEDTDSHDSSEAGDLDLTTLYSESDYLIDDRKHIHEGDKVILIIDDDPTFASIVMDIGKSNDFKVIVAEDGETGLYLADYYIPSGIILDIGLPKMDGWEVLKKLENNARTQEIPVNVVSGKDVSEKMESSGIHFYQKPIGLNQIEGILNESSKNEKRKKRIVTMGITDIDRDTILDVSSFDENTIELLDSLSEVETLEILAELSVDLLIIDLDELGDHEHQFIKKVIDESKNTLLSIIIYTNAIINEYDERNLRNQVDDIILKEGNSTQRLLNEIKIFVHSVKENKVKSINTNFDDEKFNDKVVLVVDDDMRNIFALSSILQRIGMTVEMANDGQEAIELLESLDRVDIVLMDIMMPVMDGYEAMTLIREKKAFQQLPIIALTAKAMKGDKEKCINAGANEYLSKPIEKDKLMSLLRVWI